MQKGHMKQIKHGTCTIKTKDDTPTLLPDLGNKHHNVYTWGFTTSKKLCTLTKLANFLSLLNEDTSNSWWLLNLMGIISMLNRSCLVQACQNIHQQWEDSLVVHMNWHVLNNNAPCKLKSSIHGSRCTVELTPPDTHHCNNIELAIQTFKGHVIQYSLTLTTPFQYTNGIHSYHKPSS
ncbi:hypothetical protein ACHAW6_012259 [Cyclotella cf. meneghiniana]